MIRQPIAGWSGAQADHQRARPDEEPQLDASVGERAGGRWAPRSLAVRGRVALIAAAPVATWWAVGDLSTDLPHPDYQIRPLDIGQTTEQVAGVSATVLAAAAVVALLGAGRAGRFDRRWWPVLVELVLAGALCGAGWRILTAGVIGANIGAGLVLLVGAPIVAALAGWPYSTG